MLYNGKKSYIHDCFKQEKLEKEYEQLYCKSNEILINIVHDLNDYKVVSM